MTSLSPSSRDGRVVVVVFGVCVVCVMFGVCVVCVVVVVYVVQ